MQQRKLGPFDVSELAFGCMSLSYAYGVPPAPEHGERVLLAALDAGITHFDTEALYGFGINEQLVGQVLKPYRREVVLASKGGMAGVQFPEGLKRVIDGRPAAIRQNCEDSLRRLGTDVIDLYYLHRWDKTVPIEDSVGEMSRLVERGYVRAIGLSEVSAVTLRKAHAVHPIAALQTEYSLWTRNPEIAVLQTCRELGVSFVAFSPLARGFLPARLRDVKMLDAKDIRRGMPRFEPDNYASNLQLLPAYEAVAAAAGCTPAQLALAWLLHKDSGIVPLFGTTSLAHLAENVAAADVKLSPEVMTRVEAVINQQTVVGNRYNAQSNHEVDTEVF